VVELVGVRHSEALHHRDRAVVRVSGERHDLLEIRVDEAVVDRRACGLGGVAVAPVRESETPADLHARRELGIERRRRQTDIPDERRHIGHLDGPPSEAAFGELRDDAFPRERVRLHTREGRRIMLHDARVGVQGRERREIVWHPLPQKHSFTAEPRYGATALGSNGIGGWWRHLARRRAIHQVGAARRARVRECP
jgi:hypothetical protein